ncbi:MAG: branched-chain amino acid transporter [Proteobacteria bacterium]|nr:MAG: branched-chain amino acid transporter [Pseudomonadota bacterium]
MPDTILIVLGMMVVTYLPRLLPFFILSAITIPRRLDLFLQCIPAAAIGALVIPGVFSATPEVPAAAVAGILFTLVYGLFRGGIIIPVLGSVAISYLVMTLVR